jgi:hypothetical protein
MRHMIARFDVYFARFIRAARAVTKNVVTNASVRRQGGVTPSRYRAPPNPLLI